MGLSPNVRRKDEAGPFVMYNWNLEAIVRPDGSRLAPGASWDYARRLLIGELGFGATTIYRHRWRAGDLIVWDNLATIHSATARCLYPEDEERLLHRVRLRTTRPPAPYRQVATFRTSDQHGAEGGDLYRPAEPGIDGHESCAA